MLIRLANTAFLIKSPITAADQIRLASWAVPVRTSWAIATMVGVGRVTLLSRLEPPGASNGNGPTSISKLSQMQNERSQMKKAAKVIWNDFRVFLNDATQRGEWGAFLRHKVFYCICLVSIWWRQYWTSISFNIDDLNKHLTLPQPSLILGKQDWDRTSFQTEVYGLIHLITEGRLRQTSGPAHFHRVHYINA